MIRTAVPTRKLLKTPSFLRTTIAIRYLSDTIVLDPDQVVHNGETRSGLSFVTESGFSVSGQFNPQSRLIGGKI